MKTIVLGYDDSEAAKRGLERAAELSSAFGSKVIVTSVASMLVGRAGGPVDPADPPDEHRRELMRAASFLAERGIEADLDLGLADPASHIVELAEQRGADLIVVGTHEPSFLERLLGLSVSRKVERKAHCDVLIVH
jgi:nucleotide-binding universal stress UspA family protein